MRVRNKAVWGSGIRLVAVLVFAAMSSSCGELTRQGEGSSYLIVSSMVAASGAEPDTFGGTLFSDVQTIVEDIPTIFADLGQVTFQLGMKDPLVEPSSANFITVNRYRVRFIRADGRNTPGVDVPYPFDGAMTITVSESASASFEMVRHIAKSEAPLGALVRSAVVISTIAEVTFFGRDQTGREVSAVALISVDFGNFGDPE